MTVKSVISSVIVTVVLVGHMSAYAMEVRFSAAAANAISAADQELIRRIAGATETEVLALLPGLKGDLTLQVEVGDNVIDVTGESGVAPSPGMIRWTIDPARSEGVSVIATAHLRETLLHESHHLARGWLADGSRRGSFMDAVVAEGLATAFARDVTRLQPPWGDYPSDVAEWVSQLLMLEPRDSWPRYNDWMFLHPDGRRWIGYKAGTYVADRAMKASGKSAADLVAVSTADVLRMAGY